MNQASVKQINIAPLFCKLGFDTQHLTISEIPEMYPYKDKIEDNWAYYTAVAFKQLQAKVKIEPRSVEKLAIVGIGSGVEGLAALEIFKSAVKTLSVSDIDREIAQGAADNIESAAKRFGSNVIPLVGSFAEPLQSLPFKQDFIYGNVPNLPSAENEPLKSGEQKGTFVPPQSYERYHPPKKYLAWALGAQYAYLQSAKEVLAKGGSVFTELGGRVPLGTVKELFADCDLIMSEVLVGFKRQTEALIDFEGYHKLEKAYGVNFDFYLYNESVSLMEKYGMANPTSAVSGEQLKLLLETFRVNAGQALELFHGGIAIGHTVHIFRGQSL